MSSKLVKDTNIELTADIKLFGWYNGKAVCNVFETRKNYDKWCEHLRDRTKAYIDNIQDKEKAADMIKKQLDALSTIHELLDPFQRQAWMLSVNILLKLKTIRNDDKNGWQMVDARGLSH